MATLADCAKILGHAKSAFGRDDFGKKETLVYAQFLADIPADTLDRIVCEHIATSRFFPSVAEIRERWAECVTGNLPSPEEAWAQVRDCIRRVGHYGIPQFSHPEVSAAVAAIGWETLCAMQIGESGVYHAQFLKAYASQRGRAITAAQSAPSRKVHLLADRSLSQAGEIDARAIGYRREEQA